jgi:hypothetical protein
MLPVLHLVRRRAVASTKANADRFAKNLAPIIREIQSSGITSRRAIARALKVRGVASARGGRWDCGAGRVDPAAGLSGGGRARGAGQAKAPVPAGDCAERLKMVARVGIRHEKARQKNERAGNSEIGLWLIRRSSGSRQQTIIQGQPYEGTTPAALAIAAAPALLGETPEVASPVPSPGDVKRPLSNSLRSLPRRPKR